MNVTIFGAGAIGGHLAARLARAGATVSAIARGPHLAALQSRGLTVEAPDWTATLPIAATDDPATLPPQDIVLVATKAPALTAVARTIGPLLGPATLVVFALNGIPWWYHAGQGDARIPALDPGGLVWDRIGPQRAIGCVVYSACTVTAPGTIHVMNAQSRLVLGAPDGTLPPPVLALAALFRASGVAIDETDRIRSAIWAKLVLNLSTGPICTLGRRPLAELLPDPALEAAIRATYAEAVSLATAQGYPPAADLEGFVRRGRTSTHKPSMLQDAELGRPMETAALLEIPLALGRMTGTPTPTLDLFAALLHTQR